MTQSALKGEKPRPKTPPPVTFRRFMKQLSGDAVEGLSELSSPVTAPDYWAEATWYLITCPDGEDAHIQDFGTEEEVATAIRKLDGHDVVAFVVHGLQAKISRKPHRFLILPDARGVVPIFDVSELGIPGAYQPKGLDLSVQDDGFLGRAENTLPVAKNMFPLEAKHLSVHPDTPPRPHDVYASDDDSDDVEDDDDDQFG